MNIYYIETDQWDTLEDYPLLLFGGIAKSVGSSIYVFGGGSSYNSTYVYNWSGAWSEAFNNNAETNPVMVLPYNI